MDETVLIIVAVGLVLIVLLSGLCGLISSFNPCFLNHIMTSGTFCPKCGLQIRDLPSVCPDCGHSDVTVFDFCPKCGGVLNAN